MGDKMLVTGVAGFIGYSLCKDLLRHGNIVFGIDNLNDYYSVALKEARLDQLRMHDNFTFRQGDVGSPDAMLSLFSEFRPDFVIHLAAQAGVRYSMKNPFAYAHSNIDGFLSVLEAARAYPPRHLVFASSSSVYGACTATPFREEFGSEHPMSLYAASKKANEVMAHSYAHLFKIPMTGLRFFTVYGPWGRPDMALYIFTRALMEGEPISLFNRGHMRRDFTYIDDVTQSIRALLPLVPQPAEDFDANHPDPSASGVAPFRILNIGRGKTQPLIAYVDAIERETGKKAIISELPMQDGDVPETSADIARLTALTGFSPKVDIEDGVAAFVAWYKSTGYAFAQD